MPQIPQISGPIAGGKTLTSGNNNSPQNTEPFSIDGVNAVQRPAGVGQKGDASGAGNRGVAGDQSALPPGLQAAKDPSMAVETLHEVFSGELLENAKLNGYTELVGEIDDLTKAIYINPDKLMNEILTQEKDNTVFAGNQLFEILRELCAESGEDTKDLIANLLKSLNYAMSRNEILDAVKSNIKFLAEYFGKNTTLSKSLFQLYEKWDSGNPAENFESLKNETAALMRAIAGSLQNDSRTETLVPLVTHNLSRYNTNEYMMKEAFTQLMSQVPKASMREGLSRAFNEFVTKLLSENTNSYNNNTTNSAENQVLRENFDVSAEKAAVLVYLSKLLEGLENRSTSAFRGNLGASARTENLYPSAENKISQGAVPAKNDMPDGTFPAQNENSGGGVPAQNENFGGAVPAQGENPDGTVPAQNGNSEGAVPAQGENPDGTVPVQNGNWEGAAPVQNGDSGEAVPVQNGNSGENVPVQNDDSSGTATVQNNNFGGAVPVQNDNSGVAVPAQNDNLGGAVPAQNGNPGRDVPVQNGIMGGTAPAEGGTPNGIVFSGRPQESFENGQWIIHDEDFADEVQTENTVGEKNIGTPRTDEEDPVLTAAYKNMVPISESRIAFTVNNFTSGLTSGKDAIGRLLALIIPRGDPDAADMMQTVVKNTASLTDMVNFLNRVLENIPDIPERQTLCDAFETIINRMAQDHEMPAEKSSGYESETVKALTSFIERNVNHPAIRGIDNFNASNLLQSILNAPGVFTPLAHYIIPLQVEDTRAFGELWVDNDNTSKNSPDGEKRYHLFLTFDVEAVGRFEVDAYSAGKELNLSVLYPKSYRYRVPALTDKITKIAAGVGFNVQNFKTGILIKPHSLAETFPRITENRRTFDVKA